MCIRRFERIHRILQHLGSVLNLEQTIPVQVLERHAHEWSEEIPWLTKFVKHQKQSSRSMERLEVLVTQDHMEPLCTWCWGQGLYLKDMTLL